MTPQKILQALYAGEISLEEAKEALKLDANLSVGQGTLTPGRLQESERVPKAETREVVGIGGPGGEASLAGFGVSPNSPIPQKVLGLCTSKMIATRYAIIFVIY